MEISEKTFPLFEMIRNDGDVNVYINEQNKSKKPRSGGRSQQA